MGGSLQHACLLPPVEAETYISVPNVNREAGLPNQQNAVDMREDRFQRAAPQSVTFSQFSQIFILLGLLPLLSHQGHLRGGQLMRRRLAT